MSAPEIEQAKAFAGFEHRLTFVSGHAALASDAVGAFVEAIKPLIASQTSCSDLPEAWDEDKLHKLFAWSTAPPNCPPDAVVADWVRCCDGRAFNLALDCGYTILGVCSIGSFLCGRIPESGASLFINVGGPSGFPSFLGGGVACSSID